MKNYITSCFIIVIVAMTLNVTCLNYHQSTTSMIINNQDIPSMLQQNLLIKRKASNKKKNNNSNKNKNKNKNKGGKKGSCKDRVCALVLKPCPKDCPMSCGYVDSPDPCCPLLGKPTCPDY